jgi:sugar/nucleoside kinase (ribokinase family)
MQRTVGKETVCIVGNANIDMLMKTIDEIPAWGTESIVQSYEERSGGCACNTALVLAALGDDTHIVASIGNDHHGDSLKRLLHDSGVRIEGLQRSALNTGMSLSLNRSDGERLFVTYPGAMFDMNFAQISRYLQQVENCKAMLLTGYFLLSPSVEAGNVFKLAKDLGMITLFDTGWPTDDWKEEERNAVWNVLPHVDYFLPNEMEALALTGVDDYKVAANMLSRICNKGVIIKRGGEASYYVGGDQELSIEGYQVEVRDTVGAGDSFNAGLLYGLIREWPLESCIKLGNAVAACVISQKDGFHVKWPHIQELMTNHQRK